mgnify:FL=1
MHIKNNHIEVTTCFKLNFQGFKHLSYDRSLLVKLLIFIAITLFFVYRFNQAEQVEIESLHYINAPKINEIRKT